MLRPRAGFDRGHRKARPLRDDADDFPRGRRQLVRTGDPVHRLREHGQLDAPDRLDRGEALARSGLLPHVPLRFPPGDRLAVDGDAIEGEEPAVHEWVQLGGDEHVGPEPTRALAKGREVEPAQPTRPPGSRAELMEQVPQRADDRGVHELGGERPFADARWQDLEDPDVHDVGQVPETDGRPDRAAGATRLAPHRVEQGALGSLEHDVVVRVVEDLRHPAVDSADGGDRLKPLPPFEERALAVEGVDAVAGLAVRDGLSDPLERPVDPVLVQAVADGHPPLAE